MERHLRGIRGGRPGSWSGWFFAIACSHRVDVVLTDVFALSAGNDGSGRVLMEISRQSFQSMRSVTRQKRSDARLVAFLCGTARGLERNVAKPKAEGGSSLTVPVVLARLRAGEFA